MTQLPDRARVVIIGGGIMGCATAYHLARLGWSEIVLLERAQLTCGSTFHAAGLVGQLRSSASITELLGRSVELYDIIEEETGQATGWKRCGGLLTHNIVDRNTYSYRGFYMDAIRVIDFLLSRDEVDGERIGVTGGSQGGGLAIATAALRPEIRAAVVAAPFLCGFMDSIKLLHTYPLASWGI